METDDYKKRFKFWKLHLAIICLSYPIVWSCVFIGRTITCFLKYGHFHRWIWDEGILIWALILSPVIFYTLALISIVLGYIVFALSFVIYHVLPWYWKNTLQFYDDSKSKQAYYWRDYLKLTCWLYSGFIVFFFVLMFIWH